MFSSLFNLPFLFLFTPLIFSMLSLLQSYKITNKIIIVLVNSFIIFLSFFFIFELYPQFSLKSDFSFVSELNIFNYKITLINLIFIILVFFVKLVSFIFFDDSMVYGKKFNLFFGIFLINYFSICGILISNNLFNIFLYIEFYSFSLYVLMLDYKNSNYTLFTYDYYTNGVIGSLFFIFFILIVYYFFDSFEIDYIVKNTNLIKNNVIYNSSFFILVFALIFKFFSFNSYFSSILKSNEITNLLSINILFSDILIGFYLFFKFFYLFFDLNIIYNTFYINYVFYLIGSFIIIYNSIRIYIRKNLLPTIYSFSLIILGYILILLGLNNNYSFISIMSFLSNHILIDFLFYLICAVLIYIYKKSDTFVLYSFIDYKYIIYIILLSKLCFPIACGFNGNWYYLLSVINGKQYYLFIPFLIEKLMLITLFIRYYMIFSKELKDKYVYVNIKEKISLNTNYMISIFLIFIIIIFISFFELNIINIFSNSSIRI